MSPPRTRRPPTTRPQPAPVETEAPARPRPLHDFVARRLGVLLALAVLALGVGGYLLFIPTTVYNTQALSKLLPRNASLPHLTATPAFSGAIPVTPMPVASVTAAAANDPGHTAAYSIQWFGTGQEGANEQLTLYLVPDAATAKALADYESQQNLSNHAMTSAKYTLKSRFADATIGASGAAYNIPRKAQNSSGQEVVVGQTPGYSVIAQHGRAVAREISQGPGVTKAEALAIAHQVDAVLSKRLATFPTIAATHYPLTASIVYIVVAALLALLALLAPGLQRRRSAMQRQREAERARYQYRVRGAKNLRRHRAPY